MTACIYYHPEAYSTSGPKLMGRNAAGESFLRGYLTHSKTSEWWVQVEKPEYTQYFAHIAHSLGRHEPVKSVDKNTLGNLSKSELVYYPGPGIGEHAWHRAAYGHTSWSLCGITHTTSSTRAMDAITDLLTAPVYPWDAVICTSTAVKDNVMRLLQAQADYLAQRLGAQQLLLPQLPIIPLGIHTGDFSFSDDQKQAARCQLGADNHTLIVLYMGRLSFHAKAHPLAMYQALEQAAKYLPKGKRILLLECGWHANEYIETAYKHAAKIAGPNMSVMTLDGRNAEARNTAWAAADVFCSLSDNIQETFGIVPIEAMAAGIPVVVSDWDGYKDTVRHEMDGFRIPTLMPQGGLGNDLALRHAVEIDTYDMYCGHTCSLIAVDVEAAAQAFIKLFNSETLRQKLGSAGRERARQNYDWSRIIPQYETLWTQLAEIRKSDTCSHTPLKHPWPARMDPFHAYEQYPSKLLSADTYLSLAGDDITTGMKRLGDYQNLAMVNFAQWIIPTQEELSIVLSAAASGSNRAIDLVKDIAEERRAFVFRALSWLVKLNLLKVDT